MVPRIVSYILSADFEIDMLVPRFVEAESLDPVDNLAMGIGLMHTRASE